jgi:hypothetical protein
MKTKMLLTLVAALGVLSLNAFAQDAGGPPEGAPGGQGGPGKGGKRPMPPLISALDANHDGVIDADEIAGASAALKKLDKNGDGKLSRDEYMGKPPMGGGGRPPMGGQGGQGNDGPQGPPPGNE